MKPDTPLFEQFDLTDEEKIKYNPLLQYIGDLNLTDVKVLDVDTIDHEGRLLAELFKRRVNRYFTMLLWYTPPGPLG